MRVLHVIPSLAFSDGGPVAAIRGMTSALSKIGIDVTIATTHGVRERADTSWAAPAGVSVVSFNRRFPLSWKHSPSLWRWISRNVAGFDVVHVHALFSYPTIPACRLAHRAGVPYVIRPLGTLAPWSLGHHGVRKRPYYRLVERTHLSNAAAIHVTAPSEAADVARLGFGRTIRIIGLGVEPLSPAVSQVVRRPPGSSFKILFLSRLHPKKGLELLLEAVACLPATMSARLTVAGDGEPEYLESLRAKVRELRLTDRVDFVGHAAGERKTQLFHDADVFVLPSYHENFGIAAAEAMAAGLPVIVSTEVGIAGEIAAAQAGVVVHCDAKELADALQGAALDRAELAARGRNAFELATRRYSWDATARQLIELYIAILPAPAASTRT